MIRRVSPTGRWPYRNHRTVAEVWGENQRRTLTGDLQAIKQSREARH